MWEKEAESVFICACTLAELRGCRDWHLPWKPARVRSAGVGSATRRQPARQAAGGGGAAGAALVALALRAAGAGGAG